MSLITTILLLVLLVSIPAIFLFFRARIKFVTVKVTHWILFIYVGLLMLSVVVAPLLPGTVLSHDRIREENQYPIYDFLLEGKLDEIDSKSIVQKQGFEYENKVLTITLNKEAGTNIFVERKTTDDGKIDAFVLSEGLLVNDLDFTDKVLPIQFSLTDQTLAIHYPKQQKIDITLINREFVIKQFKGESIRNDRVSGFGEQKIYLRIPKNLKLNEMNNIHYVKKEIE
ncbi:hypothetical protein ACFSO7_00380 [Bacillus sp. CGMCC 1.16607]|uniref:hypothetical protein n=1 Tax=Bacillus sp. CGMCC 1.16607 TaxID=3351842 RepID=UPI00364547E1